MLLVNFKSYAKNVLHVQFITNRGRNQKDVAAKLSLSIIDEMLKFKSSETRNRNFKQYGKQLHS